MRIENKIFLKHSPDFEKLAKYGFKEYDGKLRLEKLFKNGEFKAVIDVDRGCEISACVFDVESGDEFLPLRVENAQGAFAGEVKAAYEHLLEDIRDNCFVKKYYIFSQSNRITNLVINKYGNKPEFLWDKFDGTGIFRNPDTKKWYLAIMDVDRSKIQENRTGLVEIALIKLRAEEVEEAVKQEHFYRGYHMNKKYWITVILDDTVSDDKIMELIEKSHNLISRK